ncbi:hypothetical protein B2J93_9009 [Marssonina coronariae]|uniref:Uncharacterized protein n=1 Tax=Diplocarpon coronariae TaxID=2795749 RepID=A0A218ZHN2_9HELO|nr:hypothetical protein B2J93_9009 [Marssonina coronariae]
MPAKREAQLWEPEDQEDQEDQESQASKSPSIQESKSPRVPSMQESQASQDPQDPQDPHDPHDADLFLARCLAPPPFPVRCLPRRTCIPRAQGTGITCSELSIRAPHRASPREQAWERWLAQLQELRKPKLRLSNPDRLVWRCRHVLAQHRRDS